jgi:phage repressor protein C with HTH and peptisase S24 domain
MRHLVQPIPDGRLAHAHASRKSGLATDEFHGPGESVVLHAPNRNRYVYSQSIDTSIVSAYRTACNVGRMQKLSERLSFAMDRAGVSQAELARRVGMKQPSISAIVNGDTTHTKFGAELAAALGVRFEWLVLGTGPMTSDAASAKEGTSRLTGDVDLSRQVHVPDVPNMPRDVPVLGIAVGGRDSDFTIVPGEVVDYVRRPPGIQKSRRVFAIYVQGQSMWPRFKEGELLYLSPDRPARGGDDVVIEMLPNGHDPGECFVKEFVRRTPSHVVCRQHNPATEVTYAADHVKAIYRVLTAAELMGV